MTKVGATEVAVSACLGIAAAGLVYRVASRQKLNYGVPTSPGAVAWLGGSLTTVLGIPVSMIVHSELRWRMLSNEFTAPAPLQMCDDDIVWARSVGVHEPQLEQQIRTAAAASQFKQLIVPRFTLLLMAAQRADWVGSRSCQLRILGNTVRLDQRRLVDTEDYQHPLFGLSAIDRSELKYMIAEQSGERVERVILRADLRQAVWYMRNVGMHPTAEVMQEVDQRLQTCGNIYNIARQLLQFRLCQNHAQAMYRLCRLRIAFLQESLEERGYAVYVQDNGPVGPFRVEVVGGAEAHTWEIAVDEAVEALLIRDTLEQHPSIN